ncbi:MAG: FAD-dependent oxidoreductase [Deltaproteobacteria bacterium]|nr:FAD-dependent oxidoreductase [Deltaproteobacteria bacterium]
MSAKAKVVILGGGFAGLETAFYIRMKAGAKADITLVSDRDHFLYKPNTIYIPFGKDPAELMIPLSGPTAKQGIRFLQARAKEVDPVTKRVVTDKETLSYDYLVLATGSAMRPEEVPGMSEHAESIFTPSAMMSLRRSIQRVIEQARQGQDKKVVFLVPPNNKCSGPLYEMVFMLDTHLREQGVRDKVSVDYATFETGYIQAFGPRLNTYVDSEFQLRGITGHRQHSVERIEAKGVNFSKGASLPHDLLITFPPYIASTPFPGLPADDRGFIQTVHETRQVVGHPDIYAPGDTGNFPVKQAFLAFLQSDTVAEHITSRILKTANGHVFTPMSMCVMEQFNTATFAQVPLRMTGDPARPIEVPPDAYDHYKLGSSKLWRVGKKLLGVYLPWRFRNGKPFHAGLPWQGMELGLKMMSAVLAK